MNIKDPKDLLRLCNTIGFVCIILNIIIAIIYRNAHDVFVMDIADTNEGFKIVEYNCLNAFGLYRADVKKLFISLQNYQNK